MNFKNIAEIYQYNETIQDNVTTTLSGLSDERAFAPVGEGKWTIAQIIEHIVIAEDLIIEFCSSLVSQAKNADAAISNGEIKCSDDFWEEVKVIRNTKFVAPEVIQPRGRNNLQESLRLLEENRTRFREIRGDLETLDISAYKIPHPIFGDLTAHEWLFLAGEHKNNHLNQIKLLLKKYE